MRHVCQQIGEGYILIKMFKGLKEREGKGAKYKVQYSEGNSETMHTTAVETSYMIQVILL